MATGLFQTICRAACPHLLDGVAGNSEPQKKKPPRNEAGGFSVCGACTAEKKIAR
jgi:hypothetical protein